jgi:hypothetical protein
MRGRRPTFGNRDAQGQQRAVQVAVLRRRRLAVMQPPEPPPPPADAPQPAAEAIPVGRTVGMMEAVTEAWAAGRMALYEQPSQRLPLLSGGVQGSPDPAPLAIRPTIYPTPPGDTVAVEDPVSINVGSDEFREFVNKVNGLLEAIRQSNEIAREVRDKATAELEAGLKYIAGPKPSRKVIDLLLVNPLTWAALGLAGTLVGEAGKLAFKALLKLISPDIDIGL